MNNIHQIKPDHETKGANTRKPLAKTSIDKAATKTEAKPRKQRSPTVKPEQRQEMIAIAAYYIAERGGFMGGDTLDDWRQAEIEIDRKLTL